MSTNLTLDAVRRQLLAMGSERFDIGIQDPARGMLKRHSWSTDQVLRAVPWLKQQNWSGANIFIRPAAELPTALVLLDDFGHGLAADGLRMAGLTPVVIVQTSPGNYQCWLRLSRLAQPPAVRTAVAKLLAAEFGLDANSAEASHFGRLAGFTNRKPQRAVRGVPPFVKILSTAGGVIADRGEALVRAGLASLPKVGPATSTANAFRPTQPRRTEGTPAAAARTEADAFAERILQRTRSLVQAGMNESAAEWRAAVELAEAGYGDEALMAAILTAEVTSRKGKYAEQYAFWTAAKAVTWVGLRRRGALWSDVAGVLLELTRRRLAQGPIELAGAVNPNTLNPPRF